jgi:hypothetical protein
MVCDVAEGELRMSLRLLGPTATFIMFCCSAQAQSVSTTISIVEATYGMNCKDAKVPPPHPNAVSAGNVTKPVSDACDRKDRTCTFTVDHTRIGDPANSCPKDFAIKYKCGDDKTINEANLSPEADGKSITISCPKK